MDSLTQKTRAWEEDRNVPFMFDGVSPQKSSFVPLLVCLNLQPLLQQSNFNDEVVGRSGYSQC